MLKPLLRAIQIKNPGTKYVVESLRIEGSLRLFKRAAWAFGPCIEGFQYRRPVITVDAAFLSGRYKGKLVTCCAIDAENQLFPLAFGLIEEEDNDNWSWFMKWLRKEVIGCNKLVCIISDRHASIKNVFEQPHYGWSEQKNEGVHRLCAQHIAENLAKKCGDGEWVDISRRMAKQTKFHQFEACWESIDKMRPEATKYLLRVGKQLSESTEETEKWEKWALWADGGYRWGVMTSNASETLHSVFRGARRLPVAALVEATFYKCCE